LEDEDLANNRTWQRDRYQTGSPVGVASQDHLYAVPGKQPFHEGFTPAMAKIRNPRQGAGQRLSAPHLRRSVASRMISSAAEASAASACGILRP
jgi:hypothetical protein